MTRYLSSELPFSGGLLLYRLMLNNTGGADAEGITKLKEPFIQFAQSELVQNSMYYAQFKSACQCCCRCKVKRQIPNDQSTDGGERELHARQKRYVNFWSQVIKETHKFIGYYGVLYVSYQSHLQFHKKLISS